jgi:RimJ/RimL family protein N-acetyltransferase
MKNDLKLRQVTPNDEELLFFWANDPAVRHQAINRKEITIDEHSNWICQHLNDSNTKMWILEDYGIPAGQIRWGLNGKEAILDYSLSGAFRGRGLGKELIKMSIDKVRKIWAGVSLIAEVKEKNIASIKTITAAGFEQINSVQSGYLRYKFKL